MESQDLLAIMLNVLTAVIAACTPVLVGYLVRYIQRRLNQVGLEASSQELETIRKLAEEGVFYAAQMAKLKMKVANAPTVTSHEKKELALSFASKMAHKYGLSQAGIDALSEVIEATLAKNPEI